MKQLKELLDSKEFKEELQDALNESEYEEWIGLDDDATCVFLINKDEAVNLIIELFKSKIK